MIRSRREESRGKWREGDWGGEGKERRYEEGVSFMKVFFTTAWYYGMMRHGMEWNGMRGLSDIRYVWLSMMNGYSLLLWCFSFFFCLGLSYI